MNFLEFFKDDTGQLSATRLIFILWGLTILTVWAFNSIYNKRMEPIDNTIVMIFGILMTGKTVQSAIENNITKK